MVNVSGERVAPTGTVGVPRGSPRATLTDSEAHSATTDINSLEYTLVRNATRGPVFYVHDTIAGTAKVQRKNKAGTWQDLETGFAVAANTLTKIDITYVVRTTRVVFTPGASTAATLIIEVEAQGDS